MDRIFEFNGDGTLTQYEGGYTDYLERKQEMEKEQRTGNGADANGRGKSGPAAGAENRPGMFPARRGRAGKTAAVPGNRIVRLN